ncbi:hypothetical protein MLD38_022792 [Melastoma candidum]|uniref:Uncharacterized protein n=1 Tax=Melastoma candidum TaxID=119954 RepID=A0ACB9QKL5_9MYRT|nr:hypothetical protein MLD38_022792 [Melastoma candidum]
MASRSRDALTFSVVRRGPELIRPAEPTPHEYKRLSDIDDQESLRFQIPLISFYERGSSIVPSRDPVQAIREGALLRRSCITTLLLDGSGSFPGGSWLWTVQGRGSCL